MKACALICFSVTRYPRNLVLDSFPSLKKYTAEHKKLFSMILDQSCLFQTLSDLWYLHSLRSKRFCGFSEQRKTEEQDFDNFATGEMRAKKFPFFVP